MINDLTSSRGFKPQIVSSINPQYLISEPSHDWIEILNARLQGLVRLNKGWDGYQGQPVSYPNAVFAQKIIEKVCGNNNIMPSIVPGASGDLQIEWHTLKGDIELDILGPYNVQAYYSNEDSGIETEIALTNEFATVVLWLNEIKETSIATFAAAA